MNFLKEHGNKILAALLIALCVYIGMRPPDTVVKTELTRDTLWLPGNSDTIRISAPARVLPVTLTPRGVQDSLAYIGMVSLIDSLQRELRVHGVQRVVVFDTVFTLTLRQPAPDTTVASDENDMPCIIDSVEVLVGVHIQYSETHERFDVTLSVGPSVFYFTFPAQEQSSTFWQWAERVAIALGAYLINHFL